MQASIAVQLLPLSEDVNRLAVIDEVTAFLQKQPVNTLRKSKPYFVSFDLLYFRHFLMEVSFITSPRFSISGSG